MKIDNLKQTKVKVTSGIFGVLFLFILFHWYDFSRSENQGNGRWRYAFFVLLFCVVASCVRYILTAHKERETKYLGIAGFIGTSVFFGICWHFALELIFNVDIFSMKWRYVCVSIGIATVVAAMLLLMFNSLRVSATIGSAFYVIWGIAEYYVQSVRNVPFQIQDIFDIPTAMSVAGNYTYKLAAPVMTVTIFMGLLLFNMFISDDYKLQSQKKRQWIFSISGILGMGVMIYVLVFGESFDRLGVSILGSVPVMSFREYGTQLAFIEGARCLNIEAPEDYDLETLAEIAEAYSPIIGDAEKQPNIIVIMNETFADVDLLGNLGLAEEIMPNYLSLSENTVKGMTMINSIGGGTAKSEYEFLTGQTMLSYESQITPYVMFGKRMTDGLVSSLKAQGYATCAMHPFTATNYNRKGVYETMGFDTYLSIEDFAGVAYYGQYISDAACYDKIFDLVEDTDAPVFTFCVTMQNHSPYTMENFETSVKLDGLDCTEAEQYLSLVQESDRQISTLIDYFSECDEDTLIVFFGDHLPALPNSFWEYVTGMPKEAEDFEIQQKYYMTPFFIWANYDIEEAEDVVISTNYLGTYALTYAGVSLPAYNRYLLDLREAIPAFSSLAYCNTDGVICPYGTDETVEHLLDIHLDFQYNKMFDSKNKLTGFYTLEEALKE